MSVEQLKHPDQTSTTDDDAILLVPLNRRPNRWAPGRTVPVMVADNVINAVRANGCDLKLANGNLYVQEDGTWRIASKGDLQWLRTLVQRETEAAGQGGILYYTTAAMRRILEHPDLFVRDVPQNHDVLVAIANDTDVQTCPVAEWTQAMLIPVELGRVARRDMLAAFRGWWRKQAGPNISLLSGVWFYPRLRAACPYIADTMVDGTRYFGGAHLTDEGLEYWRQYATDLVWHGRLGPAAATAMGVNRVASFSQRIVRARASAERVQSAG